MKMNQLGFGGLQILIGVIAVAGITMVAMPKYQAFVNRAKLGEAISLGGESKKKMAEYYMSYNRFPRNEADTELAKIQIFSVPEYVSDIVINPENGPDSVTIELHLKEGEIENTTADARQYVYYTAVKSAQPGAVVEWTCGSRGLSKDLLPSDCQN
jgi:Tfp pilus assembly protein PilE